MRGSNLVLTCVRLHTIARLGPKPINSHCDAFELFANRFCAGCFWTILSAAS